MISDGSKAFVDFVRSMEQMKMCGTFWFVFFLLFSVVYIRYCLLLVTCGQLSLNLASQHVPKRSKWQYVSKTVAESSRCVI